MRVIRELMTTSMGLASLATILFMVGMGAFIFLFVRRQMRRDDARR
ncbi:MAG: DUF3149 domain-containing protein [Gammaproteobacteria bacterium]|nr:DUF3149 domain-containing protein [Gammaproteobacteria bacterium]MDE2305734.1 DUF3149 domain-containing protein [Gammaproteobacteria bacterium]